MVYFMFYLCMGGGPIYLLAYKSHFSPRPPSPGGFILSKTSYTHLTTMNYPKKTSFNLYQSRHWAYLTYSVKTWFLKILSVFLKKQWSIPKIIGQLTTTSSHLLGQKLQPFLFVVVITKKINFLLWMMIVLVHVFQFEFS